MLISKERDQYITIGTYIYPVPYLYVLVGVYAHSPYLSRETV